MDGDDLVKDLAGDPEFLRASPEEQRAYLAARDDDFAKASPKDQETRRAQLHNQAVVTRNQQPTQFEQRGGKMPGEPGPDWTTRAGLKWLTEKVPPEKSSANWDLSDVLGRKAERMRGTAEAAHMENLRRAARGEPTGSEGTLTDLASRMVRGVGELYKPENVATGLATAVAPEVMGPALVGHGGYQTREALQRVRREGWTPETTEQLLSSAAEPFLGAAAGLAGTIPRTRAAARAPVARGTLPATEDLRPLPGPMEGPRLPSAGEQLDPISQRMYGRNYNDLSSPEQIEVTKRIGVTGGRRMAPGESPTGMERRVLPEVLDRPERRVVNQGPLPETPERRAQREVDEARGAGMPRTNVFEDFNRQRRAEIDADIAAQRAGAGVGTLPPAPPTMTLPAARPAAPGPSGEAPSREDLLRGWAGERPESLPRVKPTETPPK